MKTPIVAVIEMGSKGFRLLVEALDETGKPQIVLSCGELVNLGEEMPKKGTFSISKNKLEYASKVINRYLEQIQENQKNNQRINVYLIGTEALRRADNVEEFLEYNRRFELFRSWDSEGRIQFGILESPQKKSSRVKSEAYYSFLAVAESFYGIASSDQSDLSDLLNIVVLDHGGGSTEVAFGQLKKGNRVYQEGRSFPNLGSATLKSKVHKERIIESLNNIEKYVQDIKYVSPNFVKDIPIHIFALGTPVTELAWTACFRGQRYSSRKVHGAEISLENIKKVIAQSKKELVKMSIEELQRQLEVKDLAGMLCGLIVYKNFMKIYKQNTLRVCGFGLRYGVAYEKLRELQK